MRWRLWIRSAMTISGTSGASHMVRMSFRTTALWVVVYLCCWCLSVSAVWAQTPSGILVDALHVIGSPCMGESAVLGFRIINSGEQAQAVAVTTPPVTGLRLGIPHVPHNDFDVWSIPPGEEVLGSIPWMPPMSGPVTAVLDVWVQNETTVTWDPAGRYTVDVQVFAATAPHLGIDGAHGNKMPLAKLNSIFTQAGMVVHPMVEPWQAETLDTLDVLWLDTPMADLGETDMALAKEWVVRGGGMVITGRAPYVNVILEALGATVRLETNVVTPHSALTSDTTPILATVLTPQGRDVLGKVHLHEVVPVLMLGTRPIPLLQAKFAPGQQGILGALERVGRGYVAVFGAPLITEREETGDQENIPFILALTNWMAAQAP